MLTIGSLFSGIGGLELGLERAFESETLWQVEQSAFCRSVLAKWWPDAARFDDVKTAGAATLVPVDLICGGFPCQDLSSANTAGAGLDGARSGLWSEMARIVRELGPEWVVVENVASGANRWVDTVRSDLAELGYASLPVPIAASDCGALHRRARVFLVAHDANRAHDVRCATRKDLPCAAPNADGEPEGQRAQRGESRGRTDAARRARSGAAGWPQSELDPLVHGLPGRLAERERIALGNACTPQQAEVVGWVIRELVAQERRVA